MKVVSGCGEEFLVSPVDSRLRGLNASCHTFRSQVRIVAPRVTDLHESAIYDWYWSMRESWGAEHFERLQRIN